MYCLQYLLRGYVLSVQCIVLPLAPRLCVCLYSVLSHHLLRGYVLSVQCIVLPLAPRLCVVCTVYCLTTCSEAMCCLYSIVTTCSETICCLYSVEVGVHMHHDWPQYTTPGSRRMQYVTKKVISIFISRIA